MLALKKRCQRAFQDIFTRGFGSHQQGRRQPPEPPSPPPTSPQLIEWWAVDGELFKAEKFDPKHVLAPLGNEHVTNKQRRKNLLRHLNQTRLNLRVQGQENYWAAYMKRFQALRDEWEKLVWDPIIPPKPRPRNERLVAEDTHRYVWKDPRRKNFDDSRLEPTTFMSRFDGKTEQGTDGRPFDNWRNTGPSGIASRRVSLDSTRPTQRGDQRYGRQLFRTHDIENFDDVFGEGDGDSNNDAMERRSRFAQSSGRPGEHRDVSTSEDDDDMTVHRAAQHARRRQDFSKDADNESSKGMLFDWTESGSEAECSGASWEEETEDDGDEGFSTEDDGDGGQRTKTSMSQTSPHRKGWYGDEDDLFKDD